MGEEKNKLLEASEAGMGQQEQQLISSLEEDFLEALHSAKDAWIQGHWRGSFLYVTENSAAMKPLYLASDPAWKSHFEGISQKPGEQGWWY